MKLTSKGRLASIHPSAMLQGTQPALSPERLLARKRVPVREIAFRDRLYFIFTQSVKEGRSETRFLALHKPVVLASVLFRGHSGSSYRKNRVSLILQLKRPSSDALSLSKGRLGALRPLDRLGMTQAQDKLRGEPHRDQAA